MGGRADTFLWVESSSYRYSQLVCITQTCIKFLRRELSGVTKLSLIKKKDDTRIKVPWIAAQLSDIYSHYTTKHEEGKHKQRHTDITYIPCSTPLQLPRSGSTESTTSSTASTRWRRVFSMDAGEPLLRSNMGTPNHALIMEGHTRASACGLRMQAREQTTWIG